MIPASTPVSSDLLGSSIAPLPNIGGGGRRPRLAGMRAGGGKGRKSQETYAPRRTQIGSVAGGYSAPSDVASSAPQPGVVQAQPVNQSSAAQPFSKAIVDYQPTLSPNSGLFPQGSQPVPRRAKPAARSEENRTPKAKKEIRNKPAAVRAKKTAQKVVAKKAAAKSRGGGGGGRAPQPSPRAGRPGGRR